MRPDWGSMIVAFVAFVVIPYVVVGAAWLVVKARARGRRLFRDEPNKRLGPRRPVPQIDHRWDVI